MFSSASNILISGGSWIHIENRFSTIKDGFERLKNATVTSALHNSMERFDPPKCHPNTRVAVIKTIMNWIQVDQLDHLYTLREFVMWLYGPAGAGKSAIAQTIAEICQAEKRLLASFFFSRGDPGRRTAQGLVSTLVYQLCLNLPSQFGDNVALTIDHNPLIFSLSFEAQFMELVVEPVKHLVESGYFDNHDTPRLIIIDGLDECEDSRVRCDILRVIFRSIQKHRIPLLFLVASRPEPDISSSFNFPSVISFLTRLALDDSYLPLEDIRLFFYDKFDEIKQVHPLRNKIPSDWPPKNLVDTLVDKSSGQFIYASTVMNFVSSVLHRPNDRLNIVSGICSVKDETPFAELDALYTHILSNASNIDRVKQIIGLLILPAARRGMWRLVHGDSRKYFLPFDLEDIPVILCDVGSLISLGSSNNPRLLHASLQDFFLDPSRSKGLYIDPIEMHKEYALCFFRKFKNLGDYRGVGADTFLNLFTHCSHTLMTNELRKNIMELSIVSILIKSGDANNFVELIPSFFSFIESMPWDTDDFYRDQLESLDKFFIQYLDNYYSNPLLLSLLVAAQNADYNNPKFCSHFRLPKSFEMVDDNLFRFRDHMSGPKIYLVWDLVPQYRKLLIEFFHDPLRSGKYYLDGAKYASVAHCMLTYLCNHWANPLPLSYSKHDQYIRRYTPRRWREKWGKGSMLSRVKKSYKCLPTRYKDLYLRPSFEYGPINARLISEKLYFNIFGIPWEKEQSRKGVFRFCLFNLPYILNRSEISIKLFDLCRRAEFGQRWKHYPKRTKLAKKAITEYVARAVDEAYPSNR